MKRRILAAVVFPLIALGSAQVRTDAVSGLTEFPVNGEFLIGCNYWASHAGMMMWRNWDATQVEKDLDELAANGISVLRVFPLWPDFQPLTARYEWGGHLREWAQDDGPLMNADCVDAEMMSRFSRFCDMAEKRGMKLIVGLLTGWMSGRVFAPRGLERLNLITDPAARRWEVRFVRCFVREMKSHSAIVAWDVGNECNCLGEATRDEAWTWLYEISSAIRIEDAARPVVGGMHSLETAPDASWNLFDQGELLDVLTTHPYPLWTSEMNHEPFNTLRNGLHASAESLFYTGVTGRPCFPEEAGDMGRNVCSEYRAAGGVRCALYTAWANGLGAYLWWCAFDLGHLEFPPYTWTALEGDLGLFGKAYRVKPVLDEMRAFSDFQKSFPWAKLPRRRVNSLCLVGGRGASLPQSFGAFALSRQAGFDVAFANAEGELPDSPLYILPSGEDYDVYSVVAWRRVLEKVRGGATLLVTKGDKMALANFCEATGNELDYALNDTPSEIEFTLAEYPDRIIRVGRSSTVQLLPRTSKVLGMGVDGEVMMTVSEYGNGKVVFVNAAIERESYFKTGAYFAENLNPLYLVYREAALIAGVKRIVEKGAECPNVGLTEHFLGGGKTLIIAVNYDPYSVKCPVKIKGSLGRVWQGDVSARHLSLEPNGIAIFEVDSSVD